VRAVTFPGVNTIFGVPAHPLLVHIPVVLLPLAALGVVVMAIKPSWHERVRWAVLAIGTVGTIGAVLAADAGESFEQRIEAVEGRQAARTWHDHAEQGDTARTFALLFLGALIVYVAVPWWLARRARRSSAEQPTSPLPSALRGIRIGGAALALVAGTACVVTIVQAGHSGADAVWSKYIEDTGG
jgi:uncharacterized membrane protein